jgi:AraC-like DNA-binding protein
MSLNGHLRLTELRLGPGEEWVFPGEGWRFATVISGAAYWVAGEPKALEAGDALVLSPQGTGILRASQLGPLRVRWFRMEPARLMDLLSPLEHHHLEAPQTQSRLRVVVLPAAGAEARRFHDMAVQEVSPDTLQQRAALLQIAAVVCAGVPTGSAAVPSRIQSAGGRLQTLLARMTETDLIASDVSQLATECRCSARHLGRLFNRAFGIPFIAYQTELRMRKAAGMLEASDLRVWQIAAKCGYRHLGLFNATFRRRWGQTPTAWRANHRGDPAAHAVPMPGADASEQPQRGAARGHAGRESAANPEARQG